MTWRLLLITFYLFLTVGLEPLFGQLLPFRTYSIESGLSESGGHDLLQDSKGYVWVATGYGLNRFDGKLFRQYYEDNGLANNRVHALMEDSGHKVWAGTESGISIVEGDTLQTPDYLLELSGSSIQALFEDRNGAVWIGTTSRGLWRLTRNRILENISEKYFPGIRNVHAIGQTEDEAIWIASTEGLVRLEADSVRIFSEEDGIAGSGFQELTVDRYNRVWVGSSDGLIRYDHDSFRLFGRDAGLDNTQITSISVQDYRTIWVGTEGGLNRFDGSRFTGYTRDQGLPVTIIRSLMIDREDNLWIGTLGSGISHYSGPVFESFNIDTGIPNNVVTGFIEDADGAIWIATYGGGVTRYDGERMTVLDESDGLINNKVYTFYRDSSDRIWIGTREGISIYENGRFTTFEAFDIEFRSVRKIYLDEASGEIWIATYNAGLYRIDDDGYDQFNTSNIFLNDTVMDIKKDEDGIYWFATYGGVVRYDGEEFQFITIADDLPSNGVIQIFIDDEGEKWFATFNGPARYRDGKVERLIRTRQIDTIFYFTIQDGDGRYWFGTNRGLAHLRKEDIYAAQTELDRMTSYRFYTTNQGLIANELNAGGSYLASDGSLWLGTVEGVSRFNTSLLKTNSVAPGLEFEEILISGNQVDPFREHTFSHEHNFLQATFSGLTFEAPEQIIYEYRLRGFDEGWQLGRENSVRYPSLPPGEYRLQVRAYNADGAGGDKTAQFAFNILHPFYLQWWFILFLLILFIGFILFTIRYYRIRKQVDIEKMRVQIASDLHDDVGSSLTELALQSDFLQAFEISDDMRGTLQQMGEQSRKIVSSLDDIVWSIDSRNDTAGDLTDRMQDYVNQMFSNGKCKVIYDFDDLDMDEKLPVQIKENIYLIFKEAVNNIVKHSNASRADVRFSFDGKGFDLLVSDNGTGIDKNRKSGQGLNNIQMRAARVGADVDINSNDGFSIRVKGKLL
ncbi:sensor histidine kinase [Rhodohalobacter halophilus]|uniref:sensor histidine kinase n=1 Tax=Rhodohalobacter halophilus TaxID=1812810 RepID=UPI00083FAD72|nr:sensor histidine kinase [Rhodohalobacter halophilus]